MMAFSLTFLARYLLVVLFFPFSALDKILNFKGALHQACEAAPKNIAIILILGGLTIEILMPICILTGSADRAAALVMAFYCIITALLWKQFWKPGDFWRKGHSQARLVFWDFLKNISLAGGFFILVTGAHGTIQSFLDHPLESSHPYTQGDHL